jgi:hypothetical protein
LNKKSLALNRKLSKSIISNEGKDEKVGPFDLKASARHSRLEMMHAQHKKT